ncbi:MAG: hypothetical protein WAQ52_12420 [Terriglobales bacterium]
MTKIRSLKPNVTREQAIRCFTEGALNVAANFLRGHVRSVAELYIPYRLFQVKVFNRGREESQILGVDAVRGVLDLYRFAAPPAGSELLNVETRNALPPGLDAAQIEARLIGKIRRVIFTRGFFRVRELRIEALPLPGDVWLPYWVCFRGSGERAHLAVLDAVRRRREGAKVRRLVEEWLRSDAGTSVAS